MLSFHVLYFLALQKSAEGSSSLFSLYLRPLTLCLTYIRSLIFAELTCVPERPERPSGKSRVASSVYSSYRFERLQLFFRYTHSERTPVKESGTVAVSVAYDNKNLLYLLTSSAHISVWNQSCHNSQPKSKLSL